jgi:hypothetical protein
LIDPDGRLLGTDRLFPDKRDAFNSWMQHHLIDMMFRGGVWLNTPVELREQRLKYSDAPMTLGVYGHVAKEDDLRVAAQLGEIPNRRGPSGEAYALEEYVNDRPYAASSLSVAIARTFGTANDGKEQTAAEPRGFGPLAMEARVAVLPCRGREALLSRLFAPLGHEVAATRHWLDKKFPSSGSMPQNLYVDSYRRYCWEVQSVGDLKLAPFHLLATEVKFTSSGITPGTWRSSQRFVGRARACCLQRRTNKLM